jgi:hypothetical protein
MSKVCRDPTEFSYRLLELPYWQTLNYSTQDLDMYGQAVQDFRNAVRAFGHLVWQTIVDKTDVSRDYFYMLESASATTAVITCYVDAERV